MALELVAVAATLVALGLVAVYKYLTSPFSYFEKQGVSGPKPTIFFGSWSGAWNKFLGDEDMKNVKEYGKVYGTYDGRTPNLIVSDPDLIKVVLVEQASNFRDYRSSCVKHNLLHNALLAVSDSQPPEVKDVLATISSKDFFSKVSPHIVEAASNLTQSVRKLAEGGQQVEISKEVTSFVGSALARSILGLPETDSQFLEACAAAFHVDRPNSMVAVIPFIYPKLSPLDEFILKKKALSYLTSKIQQVLTEKKKAEVGEKGTDALDVLLKVASEVTKVDDDVTEKVVRLSDEQIVSQALGFILNSSLVTRKLVAEAVYVLASKPELQDKLHVELVKHTMDKPSYEGLEGAELLDTLVGDLLRLYPSEFRLVRQCASEVQLGSVKLGEGHLVSVPVFAVHRQDEYFPKADTLNPTRLSRGSSEKLVDYTFLPFGQAGFEGKSLVTQYGVLAAKLAIAVLVKTLKFSANDETKEQLEFQKGVTGVPCLKPISVSAEPRK
ncbi:cytochrome P450 3A24-like isoform X2 [Bacillus rossius redtenbacheri]|uniref:cytochrome P450 3A24-like isoform X2 n=1 Tax=Bacillus rossius redtenbacheri TaxID=93214 RepID=UPI002FDDD74A